MTDRIMGYVVTLEKDTREDDAESTLNALRMIRGVIAVEPQISEAMGMIISRRIKDEVFKKILELLK